MFITKYRHNKIVEQYQKAIDDLKETLNRKEKFEEILEKLTDKTIGYGYTLNTCVSAGDIMASLDDSVPRYVEDVHGGKVIKQEATPVTILDENGKATYGLTKQAPDKGKKYQLLEKCKEF